MGSTDSSRRCLVPKVPTRDMYRPELIENWVGTLAATPTARCTAPGGTERGGKDEKPILLHGPLTVPLCGGAHRGRETHQHFPAEPLLP